MNIKQYNERIEDHMVFDQFLMDTAKYLDYEIIPHKGKKPDTPKGECRPILFYNGLFYQMCSSHFKSPAQWLRDAKVKADGTMHFTGAWVYDS